MSEFFMVGKIDFLSESKYRSYDSHLKHVALLDISKKMSHRRQSTKNCVIKL